MDLAAAHCTGPESPVALAYHAVYLPAVALRRSAGVDRGVVRGGMISLPRFERATGTAEFMPAAGDSIRNTEVMQIVTGRLIYLVNVEP